MHSLSAFFQLSVRHHVFVAVIQEKQQDYYHQSIILISHLQLTELQLYSVQAKVHFIVYLLVDSSMFEAKLQTLLWLYPQVL